VERIDAGDDSYAELVFANGDDDSFILPHFRRRAELCAMYRFWLDSHSVSDLPAHHVPVVTAPFTRVIEECIPCATRHMLHLDGRSFAWERLVLPLAEDGETVDILLIALYRVLLTEKGAGKPASPWA
jgi:hypothetical protein